jgi:hypothetical protein
LVVDHINNNPLDNRLLNLQIVTHRVNSSKDKSNKTSTFTGVVKIGSKFISTLTINRRTVNLGTFETEEEASNYYQNALKSIENGTEIVKSLKDKTSAHKGIYYCNRGHWLHSSPTFYVQSSRP